MPTDLARTRFATASVVRLATSDTGGQPHLVVATFAVSGDQIFTAVDHKPKTTRNLKRLRNIEHNPRVAVLADHYDDQWDVLWWVRADGQARILTDDAEMAAPVQLLVDRYRQYREARPAGPVIAITVERWTGWRATASALPGQPAHPAQPAQPAQKAT
jgi:PPOX class probable F420-dependent enzyme